MRWTWSQFGKRTRTANKVLQDPEPLVKLKNMIDNLGATWFTHQARGKDQAGSLDLATGKTYGHVWQVTYREQGHIVGMGLANWTEPVTQRCYDQKSSVFRDLKDHQAFLYLLMPRLHRTMLLHHMFHRSANDAGHDVAFAIWEEAREATRTDIALGKENKEAIGNFKSDPVLSQDWSQYFFGIWARNIDALLEPFSEMDFLDYDPSDEIVGKTQ